MFLPLYDGVALTYMKRAWVTLAIILANVAIFLAMQGQSPDEIDRLALALGAIPAVLFDHAALAKGLEIVPAPATLVTGMFLHGGWAHIIGNMLFLWVFGDNVEDAMGSAKFLVFYLVSGIAGTLVYAFIDPMSEAPLIGASGAIAGVIGAYLLLYPRQKIFGLAFQIIPVKIPAIWFLGFWFLFQVYSALTVHASQVGFWAHVGGFVCGAALTPLLKRREAPMLGSRALAAPN